MELHKQVFHLQIIKYIPLQQGLRLNGASQTSFSPSNY